MWYIKKYKTFESKNWVESNFGITENQIRDILIDVFDEFPDVMMFIDDADSSYLVEKSKDIFVIYFSDTTNNWMAQEPLYRFESFLIREKLLKTLNNHLSEYGLKIYDADFGENDFDYEIIVCRENKMNSIMETPQQRDRYRFKSQTDF